MNRQSMRPDVWVTNREDADFSDFANRSGNVGLAVVLGAGPHKPLTVYPVQLALFVRQGEPQRMVRAKIVFLGENQREMRPKRDVHGISRFDIQRKVVQPRGRLFAKVKVEPNGRVSMGGPHKTQRDVVLTAEEYQGEAPFVILIGQRRVYSELFEALGDDDAIRILLQMQEVAALNSLMPDTELLSDLAGEVGLWNTLFHDSEERFSLIEFASLLENSAAAALNLADIVKLETTLDLFGKKSTLDLALHFPPVLGDIQRQNVIIGPNGAGKSSLLVALAKAVRQGHVRFTRESGNVDQTGLRPPVVAFTYESTVWRSVRRNGVAVYKQGISEANWNGLGKDIRSIGASAKGSEYLRMLCVVLAEFIEVSSLRFHRSLSSASGPEDERLLARTISISELSERNDFSHIAVRDVAFGRPPLIVGSDGRRIQLSSGQRSVILFCVKLMSTSRGGCLALIDEPENHLHPRFISSMIKGISLVLQATNSLAVIVTHSPFVVREFERATVKILKRSVSGAAVLFRPSLQTLGGDLSMISDHVFEDDEIEKNFQDRISAALRRERLDPKRRRDEIIASVGRDLGDNGLDYLISELSKKGKDA